MKPIGNIAVGETEIREQLAHVAAEQQELLERVRTPCLVVDGDALRANCRIAASQAQIAGVAIRPHVKAHKCSAILREQLEAGGTTGVTCATAYEAETLAALPADSRPLPTVSAYDQLLTRPRTTSQEGLS